MVGADGGHGRNPAALVRGDESARSLVIDTTQNFKSWALQLVAETLEMVHRFEVANLPWTDGKVERMMHVIEGTLKALFNEG